ncbi:MAG: aminopeptidase P family protein, partial [Bacteroidetes bacterium]|nr:aminopeptidase P family protein [Bacteroidota bacterium]
MTTVKVSRLDRLEVLAKAKGLDGFLFTSPSSIKCFSGYYYNFETGPSPFHVLPAALIVFPFELKSLLVADNEQDKLAGLLPDVQVSYYSSYVYENALRFTEDFSSQLLKIIDANGFENARIGIEQNTMPYGLYKTLREHSIGIKLIDITNELNFLKAVKDEDEINNIRKASHLADMGQAAVLKYAKEGITELELFSKLRLDMETVAGARVPMMTDLVSGQSTASGGGNPTNKIIKKNELILCDLTPCLNGYWGDSCNTMALGKPSTEQKRIFNLVKEALEIGVNSIRPGVQAKEVDLAMRKHLEAEGDFAHHGGHGVGTVYHEE